MICGNLSQPSLCPSLDQQFPRNAGLRKAGTTFGRHQRELWAGAIGLFTPPPHTCAGSNDRYMHLTSRVLRAAAATTAGMTTALPAATRHLRRALLLASGCAIDRCQPS